MKQYVEFQSLEEMASYLGYEFPDEIYAVADAKGWYGKDKQGDAFLDIDAVNDFLACATDDTVRLDSVTPLHGWRESYKVMLSCGRVQKCMHDGLNLRHAERICEAHGWEFFDSNEVLWDMEIMEDLE